MQIKMKLLLVCLKYDSRRGLMDFMDDHFTDLNFFSFDSVTEEAPRRRRRPKKGPPRRSKR